MTPSNDTMDQQSDTSEPVTGTDEQAGIIPPFLPDQHVFCVDLTDRNGKIKGTTNPEAIIPGSSNPRFYEAIVRQVRHHPNSTVPNEKWSCLVHYQGWNARWDHWVSPSQLLPNIPEHRQRYEEQEKEEEETKRQRGAETQKGKHKSKQKKKEQQRQQSAKFVSDGSYYNLPFTLKIILTEEWEKINRRGFDAPHGYDENLKPKAHDFSDKGCLKQIKMIQPARSVHHLPASLTVRHLLKHFEKKERKKWGGKLEESEKQEVGPEAENVTAEQVTSNESTLPNPKHEVRAFCTGLGRLFEEALPVCLLYSEEKPQYEHLVKEGNSHAIDVYGCEFLLRLLLRLPLLMQHPLDYPFLLDDLIVLLQQNRSACFKEKFRPPEYPHEWLDWEKEYYGEPRTHKEKEIKGKDAKDEPQSSVSEDLFS